MVVIDVETTGKNLRDVIKANGFSVSDVREYLGLGSVQSVYKWYAGHALPTLDHLVELADLLNYSIDDLIITKTVSNI